MGHRMDDGIVGLGFAGLRVEAFEVENADTS